VFLPDWKELNFFNRFDGRDLFSSHGLGWYCERFQPASGSALCGDVSPGYFVDELAPVRIHRVAPDAKLIVLVRDRVERTHSHY